MCDGSSDVSFLTHDRIADSVQLGWRECVEDRTGGKPRPRYHVADVCRGITAEHAVTYPSVYSVRNGEIHIVGRLEVRDQRAPPCLKIREDGSSSWYVGVDPDRLNSIGSAALRGPPAAFVSEMEEE
jgi:hypothetical protein